ncbi:phenylacetate--CoA ligase [Bradyrhizobium sp. CSA207]|uniref:phenylacetate--CoA ligase PaaK n=1 Tax=Bradyrhizobium sp. CSA207 TaxID=2698826 RepID=UPI0023B05A15|nr:phenylacetate--CoA ligase PaaK [Bradyrhizobium sp. CSA207]MDE5445776.1 phenylacetate--CoA ligase [Bradyrhizobium sp. CSA207]
MTVPHASLPLDPIEKASLDELRALQLTRMKRSVRHTYDNVEGFRQRCEKSGVHPDDLRYLEDLKLFPFSTKQDFRTGYPFGMFAVPMDQVVRIHASSGTTGKPAVVGYTANDMDVWASVVARSLRAAGARPGDRVHNAYNYGLFTGGLGSHDGAQRLGCTVIPVSGGQTERQAQLLVDLEPTIIMVTPSYLLNIADEVERQGIRRDQLKLRIAMVGAEPWTEAMREEINRRLNLTAINYYGLSEVIGPGVASECIETMDGPTLWEDHFYPEIIDPQTGEVLPEGSHGELVITSLTKEALPVVRYRTRDLTRLLPGTARAMRRLDRLTGRSDDMLIIRGVNMFPSQVEEQILSMPELAGHYQIEVSRQGNLDELTIQVEVRSGVEISSHRELSAELVKKLKAFIGVSARVEVQPSGAIPRSLGKAVRIVDRRKI